MILGRNFVEDQYDERLYSTGNDLLDDLLEKAFCEGYELAQREFAAKEDDTKEKDSKKKKSLGKKIAIGAGIAGGAALATAGGYQLIKRSEAKKLGDLIASGNLTDEEKSVAFDKLKKIYATGPRNAEAKVKRVFNLGLDKAGNAANKVKKTAKETAEKTKETAKNLYNKVRGSKSNKD